MTSSLKPDEQFIDLIASLTWYHTIDLGNGIVTPGHYDHRPYLSHYGFPEELSDKTVLDIGAANGFFSFELERRGARVTATELPSWHDHDFGPNRVGAQAEKSGPTYPHDPFEIARELLLSNVERRFINIYDIAPETVGSFDIVFCGSVLIHLTDPIRAFWNIARVTKEKAIIATVIDNSYPDRPTAIFVGHEEGDHWWVPTRACMELIAISAGFLGIEWYSDFQLNRRNQSFGPYHGVLHAYKTTENWGSRTVHRDEVLKTRGNIGTLPDIYKLSQQEQEIAQLRALVAGYENGRFMKLMRLIHRYRR